MSGESEETETIGFILRLKSDRIGDYRERHDELWPDMRAALLSAGVLEYEIYWEPGSDRLFAWMRRRKKHGLDTIRHTDVWRRWQAHMADLLVQDNGEPVRADLDKMFRLAAP